MDTASPRAPNLDHFFSSSAARLDRWRELNAKAQTWAAEARSGKRGAGRAATEAALAEVRPLEDFFAFPGHRLMKTLAERIGSDDALAVGRLARRISGALLSGSYRYDSSEWESSCSAILRRTAGLRPAISGSTPGRCWIASISAYRSARGRT